MVPALCFPVGDGLLDRSCGSQQLLGFGPHANVFGEIFPVHDAGAVHQKLGGPGYIFSFGASGGVQQLVTTDHLRLRIAKQSEGVTFLAAESFGDIRRIDTDRDRTDPLAFEFGKTVFDASQLEVAIRSPGTAIEDQ